MKKKIMALGLAAMMIMLAACGGKKEESAAAGETAASEDVQIGNAEQEETAEESEYPEENVEENASPEESEADSEAVEVPELTYQMAPIAVDDAPSESGYSVSAYAIDVNEQGFTFFDIVLIDKRNGEKLGYENGYEWTAYPARNCLVDRAHYGIQRSDEQGYTYWQDDLASNIIFIRHEGEPMRAEDLRVEAEMEYRAQDIGTYTFEVNAETADIKVNTSSVVHGFNLLKLGDEYFIPELDSIISGGPYDYDRNTKSKGWYFSFLHMSRGEYDEQAFADLFSPAWWDDESKSFVPFEVPEGYALAKVVERNGDDFQVFLGLENGMDDDEIPFELIEFLVPVYDDGTTKMTFSWS